MSFPNFVVFSAAILDLNGESIAEYMSSPGEPSGAVQDADDFLYVCSYK